MFHLTHSADDENASPSGRRYRLDNPRPTLTIVSRTQVTEIRRHYESLRNEIKILQPFQMLHFFDVLVNPVLPCQLI